MFFLAQPFRAGLAKSEGYGARFSGLPESDLSHRIEIRAEAEKTVSPLKGAKKNWSPPQTQA
ncbi:MAG: hypothetical protein A3H28_00215 [Acidobacteria bacterium RIFCSPLOWO2_02_FULL_61_28]|nr:MAG: hypothetical protein A3H28_00215 [Acidobacteria bacterium RIFCSPLOWO2_02_FULL_61_28]